VGVESLRGAEEAGWVLDRVAGCSASRSMLSSSTVRGAKRLAVFPLFRRRCCIANMFVRCSSVGWRICRTRSVKVLWACGDGLLSWLRDSHLSLEVVVMVGGLYMHSAIGCGRVVCCLRPFGWVYVFWFSVVRGWHRHELIVFRVFGRGGMRRFCSG
jgi:hypothetical protein